MPVEILELIIRASVQEQSQSTDTSTGSTPTVEDGNLTKQALIEQCVEQVLAILKHEKER